MSSANNFGRLSRQVGRSLIYIRKNKGPKTDPCGTPTLICCKDEESFLFACIACDVISSFLIIFG